MSADSPVTSGPRIEYRLTYVQAEKLEREGLGIVPEKLARERATGLTRQGYDDVRLWERPAPQRWREVAL